VKKVFFLMLLASLPGCMTPPAAVAGGSAELQEAAAAVKARRYREAVTSYRKVASDPAQADAAGEALFQMACLLTYYDNPQRDYVLALQGFQDFIKRYPGHARAQEAENWRVILKTILDLKKENDRLNQSIQQLRKIDVQHEQ
jgi:outer membrane protein assembly factor BamD (BamD/ComL family)